MQLWLAFVAACVVVLVLPGPTILTVISYSVAHGRQATAPLVAAVALGDSTALFASLLGVGALLAVSAFWFTVLKLIGGVYLLYLGAKLLRAGVSNTEQTSPAVPSSRSRLFLNTYTVTALNPKGMVFFLAFLPQFLDPTADATAQLWLLGSTFVVLATLNAWLYAWFALSARQFLATAKAQRRFNLVGGALLAAAGLWAILAKRAIH